MKQFRSLIAAASIALMGCATVTPDTVPPELRGCWIERRGADTLTMRWFPGESASSWNGAMINYRGGVEPLSQRFTLSVAAGENQGQSWSWVVCEIAEPHGPPCRVAFFGDGRVAGEGADWMELHVSQERLRFNFETAEGEGFVLFDGARDGCD